MTVIHQQRCSRREVIRSAAVAGLCAVTGGLPAAATGPTDKTRTYRVGVVKAARGNGHTWHFLQGLHPQVDYNALAKYQGKDLAELYRRWLRNPEILGGEPPFADTRITHVYDPDAEAARQFAAVFTGARPVAKVEKMVGEVDAVLLGDDVGDGRDHLDLVSPALEQDAGHVIHRQVRSTGEPRAENAHRVPSGNSGMLLLRSRLTCMSLQVALVLTESANEYTACLALMPLGERI